jgi:hypothetical protein
MILGIFWSSPLLPGDPGNVPAKSRGTSGINHFAGSTKKEADDSCSRKSSKSRYTILPDS